MADHPEAIRLRGDLVKFLRRAENGRLVRTVSESIAPAPFDTWGGLFAGNYPAFDVDLRRLSAVAARIARGLFYHVTGEILPEAYAVMGSVEPFANSHDPDALEHSARAVLASERTTFGDGVFSFRAHFIEGRPYDSQWYFEFYEAVPFLCLTVEERALGPSPPSQLAVTREHVVRPVQSVPVSGVISRPV